MGRGWDLTLDEIWSMEGLPEGQGRIVHVYEDGDHDDPEFFFPNFPERWGNVDEPEDLKAYLDEVTAEAQANEAEFTPWRPNCQMTPNAADIMLGR